MNVTVSGKGMDGIFFLHLLIPYIALPPPTKRWAGKLGHRKGVVGVVVAEPGNWGSLAVLGDDVDAASTAETRENIQSPE